MKTILFTLSALLIASAVSAGTIQDIYQDGEYTVIQCNIGDKIRIHHYKYGKCRWERNSGSYYSCSVIIKWAKVACKNRLPV